MSELSKAVPLHAVMNEAEYDRARAELRATYGESNAEAVAKRDQAFALLFYRSGWTQERLAKKEGKDRSYIARRLLFGRFLNNVPTGTNPENLPRNLTERRFRDYWERTETKHSGNERARFQAVLDLMKDDLTLRSEKRPKIGKAIVERFADGKWHKEETIAEAIGATADHVAATLINMKGLGGTYDCKCEHKTVGTHSEYRLFKAERQISSAELIEKLGPIVKLLEVEGKKNQVTMSVAAVGILARKLRTLLTEWTE